MGKTVGIPRCLLYYSYFPGWQTFFEELGAEVVLSSPTNKEIMDLGIRNSVDEICLPVKLFFGHVMALKDKVDYIFVPRMMSVQRNEWICPKFLGLPDMIKAQIRELPPMIKPDVNLRKSRIGLYYAAKEAARPFTKNNWQIMRGLFKAFSAQRNFDLEMKQGKTPLEILELQEFPEPEPESLTLALLGHPYLIYESFINMNLISRMRDMGVRLITPEMMPNSLIRKNAAKQPKNLFWTLNKVTLGAANYFLSAKTVDGIVQLASFGCGPDALINELIERRARREGQVPLLAINLDEHTGEAGLVTRLEAFIDMIKWRRVTG